MSLKELIKQNIDDLQTDELIIISEQIKLLKRNKPHYTTSPSLEEIKQKTSMSKANWADDVIKERQTWQ